MQQAAERTILDRDALTLLKTPLKSICRDRYQKHSPVTRSLAAKIAIFSAPPRRERLVVSRALATPVLIQVSPQPRDCREAPASPGGGRAPSAMVMTKPGGKFKR